ncbi:hypothetical protein [Ammoniphilus sp. 3BR4]|uniref:hypothetical protein n=1 Tax=Ammoniphilus sp. 3BR4 TaxID=3158265 RepID=UPI00346634FA
MKDEHIQKELLRIADELKELFELTQEDFTLDKSRYNIGVMVGLEYARTELHKILDFIKNHP